MGKRKILLSVIAILAIASIFVIVLGAGGSEDAPLSSFSRIERFINSNKHTQPEDYAPAELIPDIPPGAEAIATALGTVYLDRRSLSFQFDTESGYRWSTTVNAEDENLPERFLAEAASALVIESYNTNNPNYAITKEFITADTPVDFRMTDAGFEATVTFKTSKIRVTIEVAFRENGFTVRVPADGITEPGAFKLATVAAYPFFGAVREDRVPGYVFVPDGVGALIRYRSEIPAAAANYKKEIYNRNIAYNTEADLNKFALAGARIYMPVFGFVHGVEQNAVFGEIVSGAEYANLNVYYPNFTLGYTTVFPQFVYRRAYNQPVNKAGDVNTMLQEKPNPVDIEISYEVLSGKKASYVGMAETYRARLDLKEREKKDAIPLRLETIGLEKTKGALFSRTIVMTEFDKFAEIVSDLKGSGVGNIVAVYSGFTGGGVSWSPPEYKKASPRLGGTAGLAKIAGMVDDLYLRTDFVKASARSGGYNSYRDLAKKINDQHYAYHSLTDVKYLLTYRKTVALLEESARRFAGAGAGISIDSLGYLLYPDFKNGLTLTDQIASYRDALKDLPAKVALYGANSYAWEYLDAYFDFPLYSSQSAAFTDTAPFAAIALRGDLDLFGAFANFYPYARDDLLRLIDFGVYPSFIVTDRPSERLAKTDLASIYSSRYAVLAEDIKTYYGFVSGALNAVIGARITGREIAAAGLVIVSYDNGRRVAVNYHHEAAEYLGREIPPKSYLVMEADDE